MRADVYVGGTVIPNLHCSSGNECDSSSTWSCLTEMDVSSYVTVGASSVEGMLSGASGAEYCSPSLAADVVLVVTYGASPSSVPTISLSPTTTLAPTPRPSVADRAKFYIASGSCTVSGD